MIGLKNLKNLDLHNLEKDDLLGYLGLQTRRSSTDWVAPTLTAFGVGMLVGVGVGLLMAPKSGNELRSDLKNRLQSGQNAIGTHLGNSKPAEQRTQG